MDGKDHCRAIHCTTGRIKARNSAERLSFSFRSPSPFLTFHASGRPGSHSVPVIFSGRVLVSYKVGKSLENCSSLSGAHMNKKGRRKKKKKKRKGKKGVNVCLRLFSYREILLFYQQCNAGDVENSKQTERGMTIAESLETFRWLWCRKRENAQRRSVLTIKVHGRVVGTARFLEQRTYGKVHEKLELHWKPFFHWGCQGRTLYYTRLDSSSNRTSRWCSR